jgi:outer membrane autotransporter protein
MKRKNIKIFVGALCAVAVMGVTQKEAGAVPLLYGMAGSTGAFYNLASKLNSTYTCTHANYGEGGTYMNTVRSRSSYGGLRSSYNPKCAANHTSESASSIVTSRRTLQAATTQTLSLISARIQGLKMAARKGDSPVAMALSDDRKKGAIGIASGDEVLGVGLWAQGAYTWLDDDNVDTKWDGNVFSFLVGADYRIDPSFVVGLSGGYEKTSLDTEFNNGNLDADGILVAPYATLILDKNFSIDATGGYQWLNYEVDRKDISGTKVTGSFDSKRWFAALTANADYTLDKTILLHGNAGFSYTSESQDAYTESNGVKVKANDLNLGQAQVGVRVAYDLDVVVPFISVLGEFDLSKEDAVKVAASQTKVSDDDFGLRVGAGATLNIGPGFTGRIEGQSVLFREDFTEHKALLKFRGEF